ncbi:methylmalonyl Co-A mutase-associated GTPase MeaB, partial [Streptomyces sp. PGLac3x]
KHRGWMEERGVLAARRVARAAREVETIAVTALRSRIADLSGDARTGALAAQVVGGELSPYAAADVLLDAIAPGAPGEAAGG